VVQHGGLQNLYSPVRIRSSPPLSSGVIGHDAWDAAVTSAAAIVAAVLFVAIAAFQLALALGAPLGAHVLGGRYSARLPARLRVFSAIAAVVLAAAGLVVLGRAGVIAAPSGAAAFLGPACWVIAAFLALNTLGNLRSSSRLERTVFAATTAVLAVLSAYVALTGSGA
jgi:hypothetical protein